MNKKTLKTVKPTLKTYCHAEFISASHESEILKQVQDDKRTAFTLAEVLITLTIIGVIAALTIPNLVKKQNEHATVAKVKDTYATLSQAWNKAIYDHGRPTDWIYEESCSGMSLPACAGIIMKNYLKVNHDYTKNGRTIRRNGENYWTKDYASKQLNGASTPWFTGNPNYGEGGWIQLSNGTDLAFAYSWTYSTISAPGCSSINFFVFADINGIEKKPNVFGKDIFTFTSLVDCNAYGNGNLIPVSDKILFGATEGRYCNPNGTDNATYGRQGMSCTDWVIRKGNMDYLD